MEVKNRPIYFADEKKLVKWGGVMGLFYAYDLVKNNARQIE